MATNKVFASYEEILDLHTETNKVTAIGIHTPTGNTPMKMFPGFFTQFKKYKYIGCSVSLIPAATLPADPLQVAYGEGNPDDPYTIDPREMLNPIMFHGCHGEDMGTILNQLTSRDSPVSPSMDAIQNSTSAEYMASTLERLYYKALTDRTWKKAHPQRGFKKSGLRPLLYSLASTRQITPGMVPTGIMDNNLLGWNDDEDAFDVAGGPENWQTTIDGVEPTTVNKLNKGAMQFVTPRLTSLGYLDTKNVLTGEGDPVYTLEQVDLMRLSENYAELPKIFMGILLMPPSYKVLQHYRMVLTHRFVFKNFRGISFSNDVAVPPTYRNVYGSGDDDLLDYEGDTEMYPFGPVIYSGGSSGGTPDPEPDPDPDPDPDPEPTGIDLYLVGYYGFSGTATVNVEDSEGHVITTKFFDYDTPRSTNISVPSAGQYFLSATGPTNLGIKVENTGQDVATSKVGVIIPEDLQSGTFHGVSFTDGIPFTISAI